MSLTKRLRRALVYTPPDAQGFWRRRASDPGWLSVMWSNPAYNESAHADQWGAIERNLPGQRGDVLDLGCGTGRLSERLAERFDRYHGVDLDEMVSEARRRNPRLADRFVSASAQEYDFPPDAFDLVLSMACLASACRADELPSVARRIVAATRAGGRVILIDPFHSFPALTRTCRLSPRQVAGLFTSLGTELVFWGGIHFIPARLIFARRRAAGWPRLTRAAYKLGEFVSGVSPRLFSDYSVMVFAKK